MIARARVKTLLEAARALADALGSFVTPGSGDTIASSRVAELWRFLGATRDVRQLEDFLGLLPTSYLSDREISKSAAPQFREVARLVRPLCKRFEDPDELLYVLGWAQRMMTMNVRGASTDLPRPNRQHGRDGDRRATPNAGGRGTRH